jgi:hypothetical protein
VHISSFNTYILGIHYVSGNGGTAMNKPSLWPLRSLYQGAADREKGEKF